jgi:hypothetical protein
VFFGRQKENPFKLQERTFPVDFAYGRKLAYTLNLTLPEGYGVQELPQNLMISLPNDGAQFRRLCKAEGNQLQFTCQMGIKKLLFEPKEYQALREFYDRIVAAHAEQIVLRRGAAIAVKKEGTK